MGQGQTVPPLGGILLELNSEEAWRSIHGSPQYITGTEAGTICGVNQYSSPYELWMIKTGRLVTSWTPQSPAARAGKKLEPVVREMFEEDTGLRVTCDPPHSLRQDPLVPWRVGSLDGHVYDPEIGKWGVWECKTAGAYQAHKWNNDIPLSYLLQVVHYWLITDYEFAIFSVMIGGQQVSHLRITRDQQLCSMVDGAEHKFFEMVTHDSAPNIDGHSKTRDAIGNFFSDQSEEAIELEEASLHWDAARSNAIEKIAKYSEIKEMAENRIRAAIGNFAFGILPDGTRYSWRGNPRRLQRLKGKAKVDEVMNGK